MNRDETPSALRALPSVDSLLRTDVALSLVDLVGRQQLTSLARAVTEEMRATLQEARATSENGDRSREALLAEAAIRLERACLQEASVGLRHVINASGVILHTNLGRAPLSNAAIRAVSNDAARYSTLEYETETGMRGRRGARVEELLKQLTGAESAMVVNNCAAAVLLVLSVIARNGETIISRGELVEIGGDFRVPDVMAQSGTKLVEVGATNRTRLADYERAITAQTSLVMRVHPSNFRIVGFTQVPTLEQLADVAHSKEILLYEDAGSGVLVDLSEYGIGDEPVISQSIAAGADIVSFSGDKLLGSAQAGLIVGRAALIERLRRAPLYRALRADKLALAALEATLQSYARGTYLDEVPALRMLAISPQQLEERARDFLAHHASKKSSDALGLEIVEGHSAIGGGAAPTTHPRTTLIALTHTALGVEALERALRKSFPPVIARIADDKVLLDLRTVMEDEVEDLFRILLSL